MSILRIAVVACVSVLSVSAAPIVFNFDSDAGGTATTFTDTVGGLSATFSSPSYPGAFAVGATFFSTLTGNVLLDEPSPAVPVDIPLTIFFSSPLSSLSLLFGTAGVVPFELQAYNGATPIGTVMATGTVPSGFPLPEGSISFSSGVFNEVVLSGAPYFAIDNVTATVAGVPEPTSPLLVSLGLAGLGGLARRKRLDSSSAEASS